MAALSFTIKSDGIRPVLARLRETGRDPTPVLRAMGTTFKSITEGNFNSVGAQFRPRRWPNLLTAQEDAAGKITFSRTIPSILTSSGAGAGDRRAGGHLAHSFHLTVTPREARIGTPMDYAAIHQFGGVIRAKGRAMRFKLRGLDKFLFARSVTIPARPYFPVDSSGRTLTPAAAQLISRAGERALLRQARQTGPTA